MKFYILFNPPNPTVYPDAEVNREQLTTEVNNDIAPGREFEALGSWEEKYARAMDIHIISFMMMSGNTKIIFLKMTCLLILTESS